MNRIVRWYNQYRREIWIAILIIVGIIALIQLLNNYYENNKKEESSSTNISTTTYNNPNYSVVTKTEISETTSKNSEEIINNFFEYCNNGKIEESYNLLSQECKEELYPNIDDFKQNYYNKIFTQTKMYNSTLWISNKNKNIYRLEIMGDILATGKKDQMPIEDYYTVTYDNGTYKLSISNYIGKEEINISKTQDDITITVLSKKNYIDYEEYEIKVENNTQKNVVLDTKENTDSIYIEDENGLKYISFLNEISEYDLNISSGFTKTYNIKFNRAYRPNIDIENIVFNNMLIGNEIVNIEIQL